MADQEKSFDAGEQHPPGVLKRLNLEAGYPLLSGEDAEGPLHVSMLLYAHWASKEELSALVEKTWDEFMTTDFSDLLAMKAYLTEQQQASQAEVNFVGEALVREGYIEESWVLTGLATDYCLHYDLPDGGPFEDGFTAHFEKEMTEAGIPEVYFRYVKKAGVYLRRIHVLRFRRTMLGSVLWHRAVLGERSRWGALAGTEREAVTQHATRRSHERLSVWMEVLCTLLDDIESGHVDVSEIDASMAGAPRQSEELFILLAPRVPPTRKSAPWKHGSVQTEMQALLGLHWPGPGRGRTFDMERWYGLRDRWRAGKVHFL